MKKKHILVLNGLITLFVCAVLVACGPSSTGATGTTTATATKSAVTPTPSPTITPSPTPATSTDYAFVRNDQIWISLGGDAPFQATHLDKILDPPHNVYYGQMAWFDHDRYLTFMLDVLNFPIGGNTCDSRMSYSRYQGIYILDITTLKVTAVKTATDTSDADYAKGQEPYAGEWESAFVEDSTHMLAWHSNRSQGGLYRIDVTTGANSLVLPSAQLPEITDQTQMYTMRYSSGQLFYQVITTVDEHHKTTYVIYKHSVSQPQLPSVKVMDVGTELLCGSPAVPPDTSYTLPGWDVSPDGTALVTQTWSGDDLMHLKGHVQIVNLQNGTSKSVFTQLPDLDLGYNLNLLWSPNSQMVLLGQGPSTVAVVNIDSPDTTTLYNPGHLRPYYGVGLLSWNADSKGFVASGGDSYVFTTGNTDGKLLLTDAEFFNWGAGRSMF